MKRFGIAALIAFSIYGAMAGLGAVLYATDNIATGATHNDCGEPEARDRGPRLWRRPSGGTTGAS